MKKNKETKETNDPIVQYIVIQRSWYGVANTRLQWWDTPKQAIDAAVEYCRFVNKNRPMNWEDCKKLGWVLAQVTQALSE